MTQLNQVTEHLLKNGSITSWAAIQNYHITRLSHYILLLRKKGYDIESVYRRKNNKNFVEYIIKNDKPL